MFQRNEIHWEGTQSNLIMRHYITMQNKLKIFCLNMKFIYGYQLLYTFLFAISKISISILQCSLPMAETPWNITTTVQAICKQQNNGCGSTLCDIPRSQLRIKESFGSGCLGEVILHLQFYEILNATIFEIEKYSY